MRSFLEILQISKKELMRMALKVTGQKNSAKSLINFKVKLKESLETSAWTQGIFQGWHKVFNLSISGKRLEKETCLRYTVLACTKPLSDSPPRSKNRSILLIDGQSSLDLESSCHLQGLGSDFLASLGIFGLEIGR